MFVDTIGNETGTAAGIVMALLAEFVGRVDDQRFGEVTDLCTETFEMVGQPMPGVAALARAMQARARSGHRSRHCVGSIRVKSASAERIGATAVVISYRLGDGVAPVMVADMSAELAASPEGWRFARLEILPFAPAAPVAAPASAVLAGEQGGDALASPRAVSPVKLAHVVLRTRSNLKAMRDWYALVLNGRTVGAGGDRVVAFTYDDEHHRLAIVQDPSLAERPSRSMGLDHVAFTYASLDDLLATYERLKQAGVTPFCPVRHNVTTSLYYLDPDNNRVELQVDNFTDMDAANEEVIKVSGINPVGVEFDPDDYLARRRAGESMESLLRRTWDPEPPKKDLLAKAFSS
jgi:catechol 2,3-dioxygenase-like lactoylglutathione lyase family enzyme